MESADGQDGLPEIVLRVPGSWTGPESLARALPQGHRYAGGRLYLPGGDDVEVIPMPPDDEFPRVFAGACRRLPSRRDRRTIEGYGVNVCLAGPGGSLEAAIRMLVAGAAVVRAGGAGVFVDNSGRAHPSRDWIDLAEGPDDSDAYQAFVSLFAGKTDLWSVGMHVFGLCDAVIKRGDDDETACFDITSFLGYTMLPEVVIADGDYAGDYEGSPPRFLLRKEATTFPPPGSPLHNPYGRWRLEPLHVSP
ncbi:MAG: hypothetical protein ACYS15_01370 [Planctomycetota bacterium]|jgi:hypothetical protein